jgi:hypothetical protein
VVRAVEEIVDMRFCFQTDQLAHARMDLLEHDHIQPPERYAPLVGYDQHLEPSVVEPTDGQPCVGQELKLLGRLYIATTARLRVYRAISIEKSSAWMSQEGTQSSCSTSSNIVCPTSMWPS